MALGETLLMSMSLHWLGDVIAVLVGAVLAAHVLGERRRLGSFVRDLADERVASKTRALELGGRLHRGPQAPDDPAFISLLPALGATPSAVLARGGCCSGRARLYILCLAEIGIRAHQITLYHESGNAQHCLVEVLTNEGPLAVDTSYGFFYCKQDGSSCGLADLQRGVAPVFRPLPYSVRDSYPLDQYYRFDFRTTKTANWTMSWPRRTAYQLLRLASPGIDRLRLPAILEWPQVLLGAILASIVLTGRVTRLLVSALLG